MPFRDFRGLPFHSKLAHVFGESYRCSNGARVTDVICNCGMDFHCPIGAARFVRKEVDLGGDDLTDSKNGCFAEGLDR